MHTKIHKHAINKLGTRVYIIIYIFWFLQNNNADKDSVLSRDEIQEAVNQGNLDADVEYQR